MRKICMLFISVAVMATMEAKVKKDPVLMTVAGKDVLLSEFIFVSKRDNNLDFNDKKAVAEFVELFKNLKLKVADAEALTIHQGSLFEKELETQMQQLQMSYLSDKKGEDSAMYVVYERTKVIPGFKKIFFPFPDGNVLTKDTVAFYARAKEAHTRIRNGESFESVGESIMAEDSGYYSVVDYLYPFQTLKVLEEKIYAMEPGDLSEPIRANDGYHLIQMVSKIPNPGKVRVAEIYTAFPSGSPTEEEIEAARRKSNEIYQKAIAGEDFSELALTFSDDLASGKNGGLKPYIALGEHANEFVEAGFALKEIGDISEPVQTPYGFHILKLVDRKPEILYEEMANWIYESMWFSLHTAPDRYSELHHSFDVKMKARHKFVLHSDAYEELKRLADDYFPTDTNFINTGIKMNKTLVSLDEIDFTQEEFVYFLYLKHLSLKRYSVDFMEEVFDQFVREIVTELERESLERDYPEFNLTRQEYYDGNLVYAVSERRVWRYPPEEQERLEKEWVKEINLKYPVTINKKVVRQIRKYVK